MDYNGVTKRRHHLISGDALLLKTLLVSICLHFSVIYLIPAVEQFPSDGGYIEVERLEIAPAEKIAPEIGSRKPQPEGDVPAVGDAPAQPEAGPIPQVNQIPTQLEALEPAMAVSRSETVDEETTFVGQESRLPENFATRPSIRQFESAPPDASPVAPGEEQFFPASTLAKQALPAEGVALAPARDVQPQADLPATAEQRYEPSHSQPAPRAAEQVSPQFPQFQAPALLERARQETVSLKPITRTAPQQISPEITLNANALPQAEQANVSAARLPVPQELAPALEPDAAFPADAPLAAAVEHPNRTALTQRFQPLDAAQEKPRHADQPAPAGFPKTLLPQATPISQPSRLAAPPPKPALPPPELQQTLPPVPQQPETKITAAPNTADAAKPNAPIAETPAPAASQPLPVKPGPQKTPPPDEPRLVHVSQDLRNQQDTPRAPDLGMALPGVGAKRSAAGSAPEKTLKWAEIPLLGMMQPKPTPPPQPQEPAMPARPDEVVTHAAAAPGKEESPFPIEGPAAARKILSKPPRLPDLQIEVELTIRLRFWVLPDGTVGEVIPLQRGDVRLERAAIQYLKSWRFTPVASDKPAVWGIISIKYKLQ